MGKLFVKPANSPAADWEEMTGSLIPDSITLSRPVYIQDNPPKVGHLQFTFHVNLKRKTIIKLGQMAGALKAPKCTYRTVKRDCAKRNRK